MIRNREPFHEKSTIVRSNLRPATGPAPYGGRARRLFARCPIGRRRRRPARAEPKTVATPTNTQAGGDRLIIGILMLVALGYSVAVLSRIVVQYGL